ncbi:PcfB family protein [Granulicatella sp. zg-ZJ]|uniref:PcfB family protein n=1 Tax=Granulicatella sp. zg-ZJ TaxID=2678504 RepID=UPI0013D53391|nr:PcfB family protein [Granulicatella sp. zg-ZJ]
MSDERAVEFVLRSGKLSAKLLSKAILYSIRPLTSPKYKREKRQQIVYGKQTMKKLNLHGRQLEHVDINKTDLVSFKRHLNKLGVDFSIAKDKTTGNYHVWFKGQDVERVKHAMEKTAIAFSQSDRPIDKEKPLSEKVKEASEKAKERNNEKGQKHLKEKTVSHEK